MDATGLFLTRFWRQPFLGLPDEKHLIVYKDLLDAYQDPIKGVRLKFPRRSPYQWASCRFAIALSNCTTLKVGLLVPRFKLSDVRFWCRTYGTKPRKLVCSDVWDARKFHGVNVLFLFEGLNKQGFDRTVFDKETTKKVIMVMSENGIND